MTKCLMLYDKDVVGVESLKTLPDDKTTGWKWVVESKEYYCSGHHWVRHKKTWFTCLIFFFFLDKMCVIVIV